MKSESPVCALVTGASSGIGREVALEFARRGYALALLGRDSQALKEVAGACASAGSPHVQEFTQDLTAPVAAENVDRWLREREIQVDVLVNNAGFGEHGFFTETSLERETEMVELQILFMLRLVKSLLPAMKSRGRGGLLNVASVYSFSPVPRQAVYGACKAFMLSFGEALNGELDGTGVRVTTVCPGVTRTGFGVARA